MKNNKKIILYTKVFHGQNPFPFHPDNADFEFGEYSVWTNREDCKRSYGGMKKGDKIIEIKCQVK